MHCNNIFFYVPCYIEDHNKLKDTAKVTKSSKSHLYLDRLENFSKNELNTEIYSNLERMYLNNLMYHAINSDSGESVCTSIDVADLFVSIHKPTNLAVVTLAIYDTNSDILTITDNLSANSISVQIDDDLVNLVDYLKSEYGILYCGQPKLCYTTDRQVTLDDRLYILAGEVRNGSSIQATIVSEELKEHAQFNIAQYDSSDIFAYRNSVIRLDNSIASKPDERLSADVMLLFIIEFLVFQISSVNRSNLKVTKQINDKVTMNLSIIESLTIEFSKTLPFWNIHNFKYQTAQNLAIALSNAFENEVQFQRYLKNQDFLEQIVNLEYAKNSQFETKMLNFIAIFLFFIQLTPIVYNTINMIINESFSMIEFNVILSSSGVMLLLTFLLILFSRKAITKRR